MAAKAGAKDEGWAVFNLETIPEDFDFEIALGGTSHGERDPESTVITVFDPEAIRTCHVQIHGDPKIKPSGRGQLAPRRLEILSPRSKRGVEWDFAGVCVRQLSLCFRLFRSATFWLTSWTNRREVHVHGQNLTPYRLDADELRSFRDFSRRLQGFHVERNHYTHARYLPEDLEDDIREVFGTSKRAEEEVLSRAAQLMIATDLFEEAYQNWRLSPELRLILLVAAAETLLAGDDKGELSYRLCLRMAVLNGGTDVERAKIFERARALYDVRSRLVHGSLYRKKSGFLRVSSADVLDFGNLVRGSLLYFIARGETKKEDFLRMLDGAVFDGAEMLRLRFKANHYWGLGDSSDEHLYSANWSR